MNEARLETIEQVREFLMGTVDITFSISTDESALHAFVASVLRCFGALAISSSAKGIAECCWPTCVA